MEYTVESLHNRTGNIYCTKDNKYTITNYSHLGYWEVQPFGSCNIKNMITRQNSLKECIDFINNP
jgi:hypothetical protein